MAKLIKSSGYTEPNLTNVIYNDYNLEYISINLNVHRIDDMYYWDEIVLPDFALTNICKAEDEIKYKVIISHIVTAYYSQHDMDAVVNNYLLDPENEKYKKEFYIMQNVRQVAKKTAKYIIDNGLF